MLIVSSAKSTGSSDESGWSQVYEFSESDSTKLTDRGNLYVVFATNHFESEIVMQARGRDLFFKLRDYYFQSTGPLFIDLKKAVQELFNLTADEWGNVEIAAVVFRNDTIYSVLGGGACEMILREDILVKIVESKKNGVAAVSGHPKKGDTILIATNAVCESSDAATIKSNLSTSIPLSAYVGVGNKAALALSFAERQKIVTTPLVTESDKNSLVVPKNNLKARLNIKSFFDKLYAKIPKKNIYIKPQFTEEISPQSKETTLMIAVILLVLLGVSISFGIHQKRINDARNKYLGVLREAESEVDQAISLASVDSDRSRQLFLDAGQKISQIEALKIKDNSLTSLKQKVNDSRAAILGEYIAKPDPFLDLSLLSSGFKGDSATFSAGQVFVLDVAGKRIVSVDIGTKKSKIVAGPSVIAQAGAIASYESKVFILEGDGVYEIDSGNQKVIPKTWTGDALITSFAGNMYILDILGNAIYRYQGVGNSFTERQSWLTSPTNVNFTDVRQIGIDGSIYALFPNSKILKFTQGNPQNFTLKGIIPEIGQVNALSASPDNQYLYLLDKSGRRVVVTDKKGTYKAQYVDPQISEGTGLVVSEADKKIILLSGDKLFSIDIKHL